jgi:hypothetical protein
MKKELDPEMPARQIAIRTGVTQRSLIEALKLITQHLTFILKELQ